MEAYVSHSYRSYYVEDTLSNDEGSSGFSIEWHFYISLPSNLGGSNNGSPTYGSQLNRSTSSSGFQISPRPSMSIFNVRKLSNFDITHVPTTVQRIHLYYAQEKDKIETDPDADRCFFVRSVIRYSD
ncbi:hypothetical protein ACTFIU_004936 [Dictyostelium citrinum]